MSSFVYPGGTIIGGQVVQARRHGLLKKMQFARVQSTRYNRMVRGLRISGGDVTDGDALYSCM